MIQLQAYASETHLRCPLVGERFRCEPGVSVTRLLRSHTRSLSPPPPHSAVEEYSVGSATDLTETSSVVDGDWTMVDENSSTLSLSQAELEHISMELATKGPHRSQVQLR